MTLQLVASAVDCPILESAPQQYSNNTLFGCSVRVAVAGLQSAAIPPKGWRGEATSGLFCSFCVGGAAAGGGTGGAGPRLLAY